MLRAAQLVRDHNYIWQTILSMNEQFKVVSHPDGKHARPRRGRVRKTTTMVHCVKYLVQDKHITK